MKKKARAKPRPPSAKMTKAPAPAVGEASAGINEISSITAKQMARAEKAIDNLRIEVGELRKTPPKIQVTSPETKVVLPPRPRIASVRIKYDSLGMPSEMVPIYKEV